MEALLSVDAAWAPTDLADADHPGAVIRMLEAASGAEVVRLEAEEVTSGVLRTDLGARWSRRSVVRLRRPSRSSC
jgi:hypothetical protein